MGLFHIPIRQDKDDKIFFAYKTISTGEERGQQATIISITSVVEYSDDYYDYC
jgi:hypothetical protein